MSKSETMNIASQSNVRVDSTLEWGRINWLKTEKTVARLQARIVKAQQEGRHGKVKSLTRILTRSFSAKAEAVKRVTTNRGSRTSGVDGKLWISNEDKTQAILDLQQDSYRAKPLRRKYIQKTGSKKMRPLGIPTMKDRAMQAVYNAGLAPVAETTGDPNSYGFRPFRCCQDAIEQIASMMSRKNRPEWILEGDIKGCFDNISHEWILEHVPVEKRILKQWLKCGYMEDNQFFQNAAGTPQGGIISPVIANMVLDGMELMLNQKYKRWTKQNGVPGWYSLPNGTGQHVNFVRYADDFIVTGNSREILENEVKPMLAAFLASRGLTLSEEKTEITHIEDGFDFLGFNVKTYKGKLIITPSASRVKRFKQKIDEVFQNNKSVQTAYLINKLNPMLRGWTNYYRFASSSEAFHDLKNWLWGKVWAWVRRRHKNKSRRWIVKKYFTCQGTNRWVLFDTDDNGKIITLFNPSNTRILRYTKIRSKMNPFAKEDSEYFSEREKKGKIRCSANPTSAGC